MFNAKQNRIHELEARCAMLRRKLDTYRGASEETAPASRDTQTPDWEAIAKQIASDRTKAERASKWHAARLQADLEGQIELSAIGTRRLQRLTRACARYRQTIAQLQTELKAGPAGQAERRFARASELLRRRAVHDLQRQLAIQKARADALDRRLATLQRANQATDWGKQAELKSAA